MNPFSSERKGLSSHSSARPFPIKQGSEGEEDIWPRIEEAKEDPFQMTDRGWTDSCYQKEEIIRDSLDFAIVEFTPRP